jgi:hypothetical protein
MFAGLWEAVFVETSRSSFLYAEESSLDEIPAFSSSATPGISSDSRVYPSFQIFILYHSGLGVVFVRKSSVSCNYHLQQNW